MWKCLYEAFLFGIARMSGFLLYWIACTRCFLLNGIAYVAHVWSSTIGSRLYYCNYVSCETTFNGNNVCVQCNRHLWKFFFVPIAGKHISDHKCLQFTQFKSVWFNLKEKTSICAYIQQRRNQNKDYVTWNCMYEAFLFGIACMRGFKLYRTAYIRCFLLHVITSVALSCLVYPASSSCNQRSFVVWVFLVQLWLYVALSKKKELTTFKDCPAVEEA